jgi:hypothetical protein
MKKLLVKIKVIDIPYSPLIPAQPEKWVKGEEVLFEEPKIEVTIDVPEKWTKEEEELFQQPMIEVDGVLVPDESYTYHPASQVTELVFDESYTHVPFVPEVPEVLEESHDEVIAQTQASDEELEVWLEGDKHKYPEGYWLEYIDMTEEIARKKAIDEKIEIGRRARVACESVLDLISGLNLDRELTIEQITTMQNSFSSIEKALQSGRPSLAKGLILQVQADGEIVTQDMIDMVLEILKEF